MCFTVGLVIDGQIFRKKCGFHSLLKVNGKKSLIKLRLCRAARSRSDDVTVRGGADLPRRSLCSAFNTVAPKAHGKL